MSSDKRRIRDTVGLIVQLPLATTWGDDDQDAGLYEVANSLEELFKGSGLGVFDGTDSGGGKLNLYIFDVSDINWERALELVKARLSELNVLEKSVIARSISWETDADEWVEYEVFWPTSYEGKFAI